MDWRTFTSGIKYRREAEGKEERVDLEDWARFFGIDDGALN